MQIRGPFLLARVDPSPPTVVEKRVVQLVGVPIPAQVSLCTISDGKTIVPSAGHTILAALGPAPCPRQAGPRSPLPLPPKSPLAMPFPAQPAAGAQQEVVECL